MEGIAREAPLKISCCDFYCAFFLLWVILYTEVVIFAPSSLKFGCLFMAILSVVCYARYGEVRVTYKMAMYYFVAAGLLLVDVFANGTASKSTLLDFFVILGAFGIVSQSQVQLPADKWRWIEAFFYWTFLVLSIGSLLVFGTLDQNGDYCFPFSGSAHNTCYVLSFLFLYSWKTRRVFGIVFCLFYFLCLTEVRAAFLMCRWMN